MPENQMLFQNQLREANQVTSVFLYKTSNHTMID